jgi:hypothetical protein
MFKQLFELEHHMHSFRIGILGTVLASSLVINCGSGPGPSQAQPPTDTDGGAGGAPSDDTGVAGEAGSDSTPVADTSPLCVISADCPSGLHCDLGECVQECNDEHACAKGKSCSARARCLTSDGEDRDPDPSTEYLGTVTAGPLTTLLTESDQTLKITLSGTSKKPVSYRIQLDAPHLRIKELRGEFTRSKVIQFAIDSSKLKGMQDVPGSVKFFTSLGEVTVSAPIHTGITGKYRGSLRFDGGLVNLGDARIALDVIERNGEVTVRFDPQLSLLFPETNAGPATGYGRYSPGQAIELNGSQRVEQTFGGSRNHFARDIGRRTRLKLEPSGSGNLRGTFEDKIYGLFQQPVTLAGTVSLQYQPHLARPDFQLSEDAQMPDAPAADPQPGIFGWTRPTCTKTLGDSCSGNKYTGCIEDNYSRPLYDALAGGSLDFNALADECAAAVTGGYFASANNCGLLAPLACALNEAANSAHDDRFAPAFNRLMQETLAPPLLVAQNNVVQALKDSFNSGGALAEQQRYDAAMAVLDPVAQWVLMPNILEYLRTMSPSRAESGRDAAGNRVGSVPVNDSYPAARALSKLLSVMSNVDGERTRVSGIATPSKQTDLVRQAQARAVLGYFETATLVAVLDEWQIAPPSIAADFTGVLTPLDSGFGALLRGAGAFGVPDSFVPFVFNAKDIAKGPNNFAQVVAISSEAVSSYRALEDEYKLNSRTFEQNEATLRQEALQVQTTYDTQIANTCGSAFDPAKAMAPADWASCGANHSGDVGLLQLQIEEGQARLQSSLSRIQGMKDKIAIDRRVLAETQDVHEDSLRFIDYTGAELNTVIWSEGIINAAQAFIQTASQSSVLNFGAPVGLGVVNAALELEKTGLEARRQDLQTAQSMHMEQASASIELINGMGNIQKECIDLAQLSVEMQQDVIALDEARARALNAVEQARRIYNDKMKTEAVSALSPAHDPSFRLLRDQQALNLLNSRARAQRLLYLAGRSLEYEINTSVNSLPGAVLNARNGLSMGQLTSCLKQIADGYQTAYGVPQGYNTVVSVRAMLGISGPRKDTVTGQELSEGEQFRQLLLQNQNLDGKGGVGLTFSTNLQPGNQLWSTDVCADRITSVQAQLVGDFLGDNEAQVNLSLAGAAVLRDCGGDNLLAWSFGNQSGGSDSLAIIQAGVNTFGTAPENASLYGQSVARASWRIVIPGLGSAPANADLDLNHLDDITLQIKHEALPQKDSPLSVDLSCLASIK